MATLTIDHSMILAHPQADQPDERWAVDLGSAREICYGCGAVQGMHQGAPYARRGDVRFCAACLTTLDDEEIEHIARAVALQGVPLS